MLDDKLKLGKYVDWKKKGLADSISTGGWLGVTEKYWLAAVIPDQSLAITAKFPVTQQGDVDIYKSGYLGAPETIAPGQTLDANHPHLRRRQDGAGAQGLRTAELGIPRFEDAVDWGMFYFFTKPLFQLLWFLNNYLGAIGAAILVLTVLVKAVFFPLANKELRGRSRRCARSSRRSRTQAVRQRRN